MLEDDQKTHEMLKTIATPVQCGGKAAFAEFVTPLLVGDNAIGKTETQAAKSCFHLTSPSQTPWRGP